MANKKFSEFVLKTSTSDVSHIVGYNGAENVQITPANFLDTTGGPYLPLAGGIMTGDTKHNDNTKSIWGRTGNDLEIYHDGSNSYVSDVGSGGLRISTNQFRVYNAAVNELMINANENSSVELYYDNAKKFATTSTGITVTGDGTFTGNITAVRGIFNSGTVNNVATFESTDATAKLQCIDNGGVVNFGASSNDFIVQPAAGITQFTVGESSSTFGGLIILPDNKEIKGTTYSSSYLKFAANTELSANDTIIFNANGVEKMRLDTSGNLGIGTSSPSEKLDTSNMVIGGSTITGNTRANALYVDNLTGNSRFFSCGADASTNGSYSFRTGTSATLGATLLTLTSTESTFSTQANLIGGSATSPSLIFGGDGDTGLFHPAANTIAFSTFGSERMRIDSGGDLEIKTGSIKVETAGQGIYLGGTATGNLLNDYEEGTCTLRLTSDTAFDNETDVTCNYTKIGNLVTVFVSANLNGSPSGGSGNVKITGLPFTVASTNGFGAIRFGRVNLSASLSPFGGVLQAVQNTTDAIVIFSQNNALSSLLTAAQMNSSGTTPLIDGVLTYKV